MEEEGGRVRLKGLAVRWTMRGFITWWVRNTECGNFYLTTERYQLRLQMTKRGSFVGAGHAKTPFSVICGVMDFRYVLHKPCDKSHKLSHLSLLKRISMHRNVRLQTRPRCQPFEKVCFGRWPYNAANPRILTT